MSEVIHVTGTETITIAATESIAIYTKGVASVYQEVGYSDIPDKRTFLAEVSNTETVFGPYASGATIVVNAGASEVLYATGVAPRVLELLASQNQAVPVAVDATGAVSAAAMIGGIVTSAAATVAGTIPTGTVMDAASEFAIGDSFDWSVIKVGANAFTVTAATGHTIVGVAVVATATSALFRTKKTAVNTFVTYRLAG
ncbi:hypothetical protein KAR91_01875 [Candidatus Pacearchaeota archaeon]|nr:hypothetical protein [Candidatus Pacearchaeota archaeon]